MQGGVLSPSKKLLAKQERERLKAQAKAKKDMLDRMRNEQVASASAGEVSHSAGDLREALGCRVFWDAAALARFWLMPNAPNVVAANPAIATTFGAACVRTPLA